MTEIVLNGEKICYNCKFVSTCYAKITISRLLSNWSISMQSGNWHNVYVVLASLCLAYEKDNEIST